MTLTQERLNDCDVIRAMFAAEENITIERAAIAYSDNRLNMAKEADPVKYAEWLEKAYQWSKDNPQ